MHELIERKAKRKVELVSVSPKPKEKEEKKEEKKEVVPKTTVIKVHLHCDNCEHELKMKILKLKGVHSVKTNREAETFTIVGTVDEKKLIEYIRKKAHKHGEIVPQKKKEEEKASKEAKAEAAETKEEKSKDIVVPYFIHCTHAPQWFSDEDPNACSVM